MMVPGSYVEPCASENAGSSSHEPHAFHTQHPFRPGHSSIPTTPNPGSIPIPEAPSSSGPVLPKPPAVLPDSPAVPAPASERAQDMLQSEVSVDPAEPEANVAAALEYSPPAVLAESPPVNMHKWSFPESPEGHAAMLAESPAVLAESPIATNVSRMVALCRNVPAPHEDYVAMCRISARFCFIISLS